MRQSLSEMGNGFADITWALTGIHTDRDRDTHTQMVGSI